MIFLDLETLDFFGDPHIKRLPRAAQLAAMRFGLAVTYDTEFREWWPGEEAALWRGLIDQTIVGWNIFDFDIPHLMFKVNQAGYDGDCWFDPMTLIDLMDLIKRASKPFGRERWYKLEDIAVANLGRGKLADGQLAAEWLRSGDTELRQKAAEYCQADVQLTIDLFQAAQGPGLLLPARSERGESGDLRLRLSAAGAIVDCKRDERRS